MATKADAIKVALEAVAQANAGRITPTAVVAAASDPSSALHDQFTWDDAVAAAERRLDQARTLIRSVRVQFTVESRVVEAPFYVRDPESEPNEQGYTTLPRLVSDREAARKAVIREFTVAEAALSRAKSIAAVLEETDTIDSLALGLKSYRQELQSPAS